MLPPGGQRPIFKVEQSSLSNVPVDYNIYMAYILVIMTSIIILQKCR